MRVREAALIHAQGFDGLSCMSFAHPPMPVDFLSHDPFFAIIFFAFVVVKSFG